MPDVLAEEQWNALVRVEPDVFRLAIRGQNAIEAEIDAAITEAFVGPVPAELRHLGVFRNRLTLAVAMGVVEPAHEPGVAALAKLRNAFAHGDIEDLSRQRAESLLNAWGELVSDDARDSLRANEPIWSLRVSLIVARVVVRFVARVNREARALQPPVDRAEVARRIQAEVVPPPD